MGVSNFKSGYGMTNQQFIDWLTVRLRAKDKGPLTPEEVADITHKVADLCEPLGRFTYYLQNRIGPLRGETDPEAFRKATEKLREMVEDYIIHPEMYKF